MEECGGWAAPRGRGPLAGRGSAPTSPLSPLPQCLRNTTVDLLPRLLASLQRTRRALRHAGLARVVIGAWLAVHGFAVAAAPLADALAGHAESVVAHWEDAQDDTCPPLHDPATCQLCQQIGTSLLAGASASEGQAPVARVAGIPPRDAGLGAYAADRGVTPDPRGPPAA